MSSSEVNRRGFLQQVGVGTAAAATVATVSVQAAQAAEAGAKIKIVGVSTSLRKGKTTAAAVQRALEAAQAVAPDRIEIELIELAGLKLPVNILVGEALEPGERDDFPALADKLAAPEVAGIIIGTPTYFANMSSLCKMFLERWMVFRKNNFPLSNKVGGVLATGGARDGGQELTIQSVQATLLCHELLVVGDGRPSAHFGPVLWNQGDDLSQDEIGLKATDNLGRRVGEVALRMAAGAP
jgi:multimeric flavodoxin WrbA